MASFRFNVTRPGKKAGSATSQWLSGSVERGDAAGEALALLTDPRDTITGVYLWSDKWQQYVDKWTPRDVARLQERGV